MQTHRQANNPEFTDRLKRLIKSSGLDNHGFASKAEMGYSTLMTYLRPSNAGRVAQWDQLVKIAKAGKQTVDWLLTGQDSKHEADCPLAGCDEETIETCRKVKEIMGYESHWKTSLKANVESFKAGLDNDRKMKDLERKLENLSKLQGAESGTQEDPAGDTGQRLKAG